MHALEVGDLGLVAGLDERLESGLDQRADAAAEDGLFAEQVGFGLLGEGGFDDARARDADALRVGQREGLRIAGRVLVDGVAAPGCLRLPRTVRERDARATSAPPS